PTEIHDIKRRQSEGLQAFMDQFKSDSSHIKGVSPVLLISAFMHGYGHPNSLRSLTTRYPRRWTKCSRELGRSLGEKWPMGQQKWFVLPKETKEVTVEVNLRGLLELDKSDISAWDQLQRKSKYNDCEINAENVKYGSERCCVPSWGNEPSLYTIWDSLQDIIVGALSWTKLITLDLICPSTYQLLWNSSGDSGPDLSFDKSASLKHLFGLARASLVAVSKLVHFSQLGPLGLNKVITFEVLCWSLQIEQTMTLFKHWKSGFFLIDRRAIPDAMVWRHPNASINDPRSVVGSFNVADVRRLSAHVIKLMYMPDGVLVLSGLSLVWKNYFCDPVLQCADRNVMEDLATGTPSSKILGKSKASQKRKASTSGAASSHVIKRNDDESDDDDACVKIPLVTPLHSAVVIPSSRNQDGSSVAPTTEGSNTRDSRGKGTMVDDAAAPSGGGLSNDQLTAKMSVLHCLMMSHGGELLARYRGLNQSHHECVLSTDSRLKGYEERVAGLIGLELQSKAKGKERKKKIKSLSKSLYNLYSKVARLSATFNQAVILEAERDEEILWLKATPLEFSSFFRGQFQGLTKDEFADVLKKMVNFMPDAQERLAEASSLLEPEKLVHPAIVPIPKDTYVSPPIAKESTVTPVSKSLELSANVVPASFVIALKQNEEKVSAAVDGSDLEMTDGAAHSKSGGVFVQGTSHVLDDVAEVTVVGLERVSSSLTNVVVALSAGEKGDGSALSSTVEEVVVPPFGV
ncbi:hypothetical protein Tco_0930738, partial [Tanacetum coccineum]